MISPEPLQGSVWINNRSRIVKSDYTTSNGIIHHIDRLLTPYRLEDKPQIQSQMVFMSYFKVAYEKKTNLEQRAVTRLLLFSDEPQLCSFILWLRTLL